MSKLSATRRSTTKSRGNPTAEAVRARAIQTRRIQLGWNQQELALCSNLTRRTVSRAETGCALALSTVLALEEALSIKLPFDKSSGKAIRPNAAAVGAFLRNIRLETTSEMFPHLDIGRKLTLAAAAESLRISTSQLSLLERGLAAPKSLFQVGLPEGDVFELNRSAWQSAFYKPYLDKIENLATADGQKGRFRN